MIRPFSFVIASQRVGAKRRPMTGSATLSAVAQRAKAEAIHSGHPKSGLLRRGACHRARIRATRWLPGNDGSRASIRMSNSGYTSAFSRREAPEVCVSLSLKRGSRECRMRAAPAVSCAKYVQRKRTRAYRFSGGNPTFPAQWLYGLLRALPGVSGFLASVASRKPALWPGWAFAPPLRLDANH